MKNHSTGSYFELDDLTYRIWTLTDGKRTVEQIINEVRQVKPRVSVATIAQTLILFAQSNLLVSTVELAPKKRFRVASAFEIDVALVRRSNEFFQSFNARFRPLFRRSLLWFAITFIIIGAALFASDFVSIYGTKANFEILGSTIVGFFFYTFVVMSPVITIHEIAHGSALAHYGGKPGEMGTGLFYFGPMFYTETTDAWGLSRGNRIMVFLAGNLTTLLIGSVIVIVRMLIAFPPPYSQIVMMAAFYCFSVSLFNFAPPFETDGYYVLADALRIPNLRQDAFAYLSHILKRAVGKKPKMNILGLSNRKKQILLAYAVVSAVWIGYIVFQSSLFLVYMAQDVTTSVANVVNSVLSSQALQASILIVAIASVAYFLMQIVGYGFMFSTAVKKAVTKPLQIEAIHDRDLAVFAYLPPQTPEKLSKKLVNKMENAARRFTSSFETRNIGRSCVTILRMGGANLAVEQIKDHLGKIENEFSSAFQDIMASSYGILEETAGIYSPSKVQITDLLDRLAEESADTGNSTARAIAAAQKNRQRKVLRYLVNSAWGTVWTIELDPRQKYDLQKRLLPGLLLEDLTLTDIYDDTENFKKQTIFGYDSLAKLATETRKALAECLNRPDEYQLLSIIQPIRSRIVFVGRTENLEKNIQSLVPLFVDQAWVGYLDNLLCETCFALAAVERSHLPDAREIREMTIGELAVLNNDFGAFSDIRALIGSCIISSKRHLAQSIEGLKQVRSTLNQPGEVRIGLSDSLFNINSENFESLPGRLREFERGWKFISKRLEDVQGHVKSEYEKRRSEKVRIMRKTLRFYPIIAMISIALGLMFLVPFLSGLWTVLVAVVSVLQMSYWIVYYRRWKSQNKASRYPTHAFNASHLFLLALVQAVYGYVSTEDIITPA